MSDEAIERFTRKARRRLTKRPADAVARRRKELEIEAGHLLDAIGKGLLSPETVT